MIETILWALRLVVDFFGVVFIIGGVAAPAIEKQEKIVAITHNSFVHPDAKEGDERTFGPVSWKRADGQQKSKECDRSVVGVIVVGEGRGESFRVCVDKQKCKTHWGAEIARRAKSASSSSSKSSAPAKPAGKPQWEIDREKREKKQAEWKGLIPKVLPALTAHVKKMPAGGRSLLGQIVLDQIREEKKASALISRGTTAEDLIRHGAFQHIYSELTSMYDGGDDFAKLAKEIGFDLASIIKANAPKPETPHGPKPVFAKPATSTKTSKPKKKRRTPNAAFMKEMTVSEQLAAVIGKGPMVRTEVTKKLWAYIKRNNLQDPKERRMLMADEKLLPVFGGKKRVSMFDMTKLVNKHLKA